MKLSSLIKSIIQEDARYFMSNSFITSIEHDRALAWLSGKVDNEIQMQIAAWLKSDAAYFMSIRNALSKHHWYIAPLVYLVTTIMSVRLKKAAEEIERLCPTTATGNAPSAAPQPK